MKNLNLGFGRLIKTDEILGIVDPNSAPIKRLIAEARQNQKLLDATQGRRTRSVVILTSGQIWLSSRQPETLSQSCTLKIKSAIPLK